MGAPGTRNCCLAESAGEWASFLDDDVLPAPDPLRQVYSQGAAGVVRNRVFPHSIKVFMSVIHIARRAF